MVVKRSPRGSALRRELDPADAYSAELEVLRLIEFQVRKSVWIQTTDAQKGRNRPEPLRFAWEPATEPDSFGMDVMDTAEMARRLGWPAPTQ